MAKYSVMYACGHTDTVNLIGPTRTREWILKNKEQELCPDCYRAQLEAKREADRAWQEKNPGGRRIAIWHPKRDTVELVRHSGPGDLVTDGIELYPYPDLHQRSILAQMPGPGDDEVRIGLEWVE